MTDKEAVERITTLLWEYAADYTEKSDKAKEQLHKIFMEENFPHYNPICEAPIRTIDIQTSEEIEIISCISHKEKILIEFSMTFIAIINRKSEFFHIEGCTVGNVAVPSAESFNYDKYDFDSMSKSQLVEHYNIFSQSDISFDFVEYMGE